MKIDLPVNFGDTVYYLIGSEPPRIEKGTVIGFEIKNNITRIVADFDWCNFAIIVDVLGTRLFLNEKEAQEELEKWRKADGLS